MRIFYLVLILSLHSILKLEAQESIKIFVGGNYSNATYHRIDQGIDSFGFRKDYILLPSIGIDIDFNAHEKLKFTTGLGISSMGSRNYTDTFPSESFLSPNLKLNYLRIPLIIKYSIGNNANVFSGYSFNYCFRKNYNFLATDSLQSNYINIFNRIHHGLIFGFGIDVGNVGFTFSYHQGLNKIWDTQQLYTDKRAFLNLAAFQFTVGYFIRSNKSK